LVGGASLRVIAGRLGRAPSTISREVAGNGGRRRYRACRADTAAVRRLCRPKASKLASCPRLRVVVEAKLERRWSPQQISGWLVESFPDDPEMRVSHEMICLSVVRAVLWRVTQGTDALSAVWAQHASASRVFGDERSGAAARDVEHSRMAC
jgi:IS30 family transposase